MEVDILLNMDGFDDSNMTPVFTDSGSTAFPAFSATSDPVTVNHSANHLHANYHPSSPFFGNSRPWSEANVYTYGFQDYPQHTTTNDNTLYDSDPNPDRSSISAIPFAPLPEDPPWQIYLTPSLSDPLHSVDLENPDTGLVYPQLAVHDQLETLGSSSSSYQGPQMTNGVPQVLSTTPLVAPQPGNIQPALLSMMSTQDSLFFAQGDDSTEPAVYTSSLADVNAPPLPSCRGRSPTITKLVNRSSTRPKRGLRGWGTTDNLPPPVAPFPTHLQQKEIPSNSILTVPDTLSLATRSSSKKGSPGNSERFLKRSRKSDESPPNFKRASKARRLMAADNDTEGDGGVDDIEDGGDSDSDDYAPSRSPSPSRSISPSVVLQSETGMDDTLVKKKIKKKGKGKAKGSAALALAVVSEMIREPSSGGRRNIDLTTTRYGITRRKNQSIPLPIPVPNLNKKSRGRKVPHVTNDAVIKIKKEDDAEEDQSEEEDDQSKSASTRSTRRKHTSTTPTMSMSKTPSGENRTFVCVVSGCGKCFVRSEHLKRHVRSIHTHDKPYPCPFEGCDKSFSRRDNLGQHVRIHLQS